LYISDCPSISEGKVRGSEVQKRVQRSQRSISEMFVKDDFQIKEGRLHYMSFIIQSEILIKVGVKCSEPECKTCEWAQNGYKKTWEKLR